MEQPKNRLPKDSPVSKKILALEETAKNFKTIARSFPEVSGVGYGFRRKDGRPTRDLVIIVLIKGKEAPSNLPKHFDGFDVDIWENHFTMSHGRLERWDSKWPPGISIGPQSGGWGTCGMKVYCKADPGPERPYIITATHVIASPPWMNAVGTQIFQPGTLAQGVNPPGGDFIGDVVAHTYIDSFTNPKELDGDTALIRTTLVRPVEDCVLGLFNTYENDLQGPYSEYVKTALGRPVVMSGATSGVINGRIVDIFLPGFEFGGERWNGWVQRQAMWCIYTPNEQSKGGDSGAVWFDEGTDLIKPIIVGMEVCTDESTMYSGAVDLYQPFIDFGIRHFPWPVPEEDDELTDLHPRCSLVAAYGAQVPPERLILQAFRFGPMEASPSGRALVEAYHKIANTVYRCMLKNPTLRGEFQSIFTTLASYVQDIDKLDDLLPDVIEKLPLSLRKDITIFLRHCKSELPIETHDFIDILDESVEGISRKHINDT